jgi:hypothetical protein
MKRVAGSHDERLELGLKVAQLPPRHLGEPTQLPHELILHLQLAKLLYD